MIQTLNNLPVKFDNTTDACDSFDEREYCQMAEQSDTINFAWKTFQTGDNVVVCGDFATEACIIANWTLTNWGFSSDSSLTGVGNIEIGDNTTLGTETDTAIQSGILSPGCWKITITIPGYPFPFDGTFGDPGTFNKIEYAGSFHIEAGDAISESKIVTPGTHTFYVTIGSGTDLVIVPEDAIIVISEVTAVPMCCDFSIDITTKDGTFVKNTNDIIFDFPYGIWNVQDTFYFGSTWSALGLDEGCYRFCIIAECESGHTELISNGDFSTGSDWNFNGEWTYDAGNDEADHSSAGTSLLEQVVNIYDDTVYLLSYQIKNYTAGTITPSLDLNIGEPRTANGIYTEIIRTGSNTVPILSFTPTSTFRGSIDNVSLKVAERHCSVCYDLKNTHECTKLLSWTNDDDAFGIPYSDISFVFIDRVESFTHYLRVYALIEKPRYPQEIDRFTFSSGQKKILFASGEKIWTLFLDYLPEYLHDAIAIGKMHDHFYIDGIEYICTTDEYQPEWRNRLKLAQAKIEIQKVIDLAKNRNC